jgi:hypothetical protein
MIMMYGKQIAAALVLSGVFLFTRNVQAQEIAFFRNLSGTVEVKAPGSAAWTNAVEGNRIEKNTIISTGFKSTAVVVLGDSVLTVRPLTRLSLEEIIRSQNDEQVNLYLHTGRVRADVSPPSGGKTDFVVRSPVATASVRGTSFEFDTERLVVEEGRVQYSLENGRQTYVAAGGMSYVDETGNALVNPFEAVAELLTPALPPGSGSGGPMGDNAPVVDPVVDPVVGPGLPDIGDVGVGFDWD